MSKGGGETTATSSIDADLKKAYLGNLRQAQGVAGALPVRQFAGFNPLYTAGEQQVTNEALNPFTGESIQQFMNPYETDVIQRALGDVGGALQTQQLRDRQAATAAKAFGGSRQGVQESLTNAAALKQAADTAAQMRAAGYGQAAQLAQYAKGANIAGGQAVMGLGGARQQLEQAQMDALRNIGIEKLGIATGGLSTQLPNLGMTQTQPYYQNRTAGALGGATAGYQFGGPWGAAAGGLLGYFG
ncbi:hypothetical protein UFOVP189_50 [uncultured Caudovirales phage]|uniref:Uncharacterized protein n=1 Tax=uncultured Caudovirales phage TaxID=2100421 RepID=A0A6J7WJ02_9CAUD|nr:hypothetical protein UFOVP189_50 [uncultured Caudovirales phage]